MARPGPATLALLLLFGLSFVVQLVLSSQGIELAGLLALTYDLDLSLAWRWLTYPLVEGPGQILNRLLGLLFAYVMLGQHELRHGPRSTLGIALAGIVGAAAVCLPVGLAGFATPLVGLSGLLWAPIGRLLVDAGEQPVQIFSLQLPNARVATGVLLLLPAASALYWHDPTPLLEALGAGAAGFLFGMAAMRARLGPSARKKKPSRGHGLRVIRGGRDDDDERPKYLN
jgi:membrane associated rhomboid family serine protease